MKSDFQNYFFFFFQEKDREKTNTMEMMAVRLDIEAVLGVL